MRERGVVIEPAAAPFRTWDQSVSSDSSPRKRGAYDNTKGVAVRTTDSGEPKKSRGAIFSFCAGSVSTLALVFASAAPAWAQDSPEASDASAEEEEIVVTGYTLRARLDSATGLDLSLRETPQSVTVIDQERIQDFALTNANDLLDHVVGVNVERGETERLTYNSRGFDVTNFQVDGIGLPLIFGLQFGELDTILFERVDIVRGANAIMTGIGNPSATVNYIRKRPLDELGGYIGVSGGSYDMQRFEADLSAPLGDAAAMRLLYAHEDRDSHLDRYHLTRDVYGAIFEANLTSNLTATVGYTLQDSDPTGVMWGSVPQFYSDGTPIPLDRSANAAPGWTDWPVIDEQAFAELAWSLNNGWRVRGVLTYKQFEESETIVYVSGFPDPVTGLGLDAYAGDYYSNYERYLADFVAAGPFELFGRQHQLAAGVSWALSNGEQYEADFGWFPYPAYSDSFNDLSVAVPTFLPFVLQVDLQDTLWRGFVSSQISVSDNLNLVVGASVMNSETEGSSYGEDQAREGGAVSPYFGAVYEINANISLYGSYTDIYSPQEEVDINRQKLDPIHGTNVELGFKSEWFDEQLYVTGALFRTEQSGIAEYAGFNAAPFYYYYIGVDNTSEGVELEFAGRVTEDWRVSGGYTHLFSIADNAGQETRQYQPRTTIKLATSYTVPQLNDLTLAAQLRWQSDIFADVAGLPGTRLEQDSYTTVDLSAAINLTDRVRLSGVLRNATDEDYLYSLSYGNDGHAFSAPGRNFLLSLRYDF